MGDNAFDMDGILTEEEARELFGGGGDAAGAADAGGDAKDAGDGEARNEGDAGAEATDGAGGAEAVDDGDDTHALSGDGAADVGGEGGGAVPDAGGGASPGVFSSIAAALRDEGLLDGLDDGAADAVKDAQGLSDLFDKIVETRLDERTRRIGKALEAGVAPDAEARYQSYMDSLNSYTDEVLRQEGDRGDDLRRRIIFTYYRSLGFDDARCKRECEKSAKAGTDVDDALEARDGLASMARTQHEASVKEAKERSDARSRSLSELNSNIEKAIMGADTVMDGVRLDNATKRKACDFLLKRTYEDKGTGERLTGLEKALRDDAAGTYASLGLWFALTDGGRKLSGVVDGKVKAAKHKALDDLAAKLRATSMNPDGSLNYAGGSDAAKGDVLLSDKWRIG